MLTKCLGQGSSFTSLQGCSETAIVSRFSIFATVTLIKLRIPLNRKILDSVVNSISRQEWDEFFKLDPSYIASTISDSSGEEKDVTKVSKPVAIMEKFVRICSILAENMLNRINWQLIEFYDGTLAEHLCEQNSTHSEDVSLETGPLLNEDAQSHSQIMIVWLFSFLCHGSFKCNHNVNPLKLVDKIAKCERKIVDAASDAKLRPVTKQIFQKYCILLWESLNESESSKKDDAHMSGVWLSTVLRGKAKKCSHRISPTGIETKIQKEQKKAKKGGRKKMKFGQNNIENVDSKIPDSDISKRILTNEIANKLVDGMMFKEPSNKVEGDLPDKLINVRNHESDLIARKMAVTGETSDEANKQKPLPQLNNSVGKASYSPYTLDTLNDCALALAKIIAEMGDSESDDFFAQSPQIEVRDLSFVFVGNIPTASSAESDDQKRLKAVKGNFLFIAYREIVYALKQNEKSVERSHLNGLIERNKRIFVDIILRSKKFEQTMTEWNTPNNNVWCLFGVK